MLINQFKDLYLIFSTLSNEMLRRLLILQPLPGMGLHRSVKLVSHFGSAEPIFCTFISGCAQH